MARPVSSICWVILPPWRAYAGDLQYRLLGNTGLRVSILGLGSASLGGVYGDVEEAAAVATVHRAFELGVNVFDSSPYYGQRRGETVLGKGYRVYRVPTTCS